jgi:c-di-GMP-binding flagellar brake protein YcgR
MMTQKPRAPRTEFTEEVHTMLGNRQLDARAVNLSASGMLLELPDIVEPVGYLHLDFELGPRHVSADAILTRVALERGLRFWGVQFVDLSGETTETLQRWVLDHGASTEPSPRATPLGDD